MFGFSCHVEHSLGQGGEELNRVRLEKCLPLPTEQFILAIITSPDVASEHVSFVLVDFCFLFTHLAAAVFHQLVRRS